MRKYSYVGGLETLFILTKMNQSFFTTQNKQIFSTENGYKLSPKPTISVPNISELTSHTKEWDKLHRLFCS